jgi:peptidoglycan/xylan/chitin deacetylase (PgdA/CDA1 family)
MEILRATYLLRFDDLCPTMSKQRFDAFMVLAERYGIRPVLAVVPDNQDAELKIDDPDPTFWSRMRDLQAAGATIALHGYRHSCSSSGRSLLRLHSRSEFAGVPEETQRKWIQDGLATLRTNGLSPRLFVAPRHGFDSATLRALRHEALGFLSDGFASRPFTRGGVLWIPQQLWEPVKKPRGLWTICLHTNTAQPGLLEKLDCFLREYADQFTNFDQLISEEQPTELRWNERLHEALALQRVRRRSA